MGPSDELTPEERAWLESPSGPRGYQPDGEEAGTRTEPPAPPSGRASASHDPGRDENE